MSARTEEYFRGIPVKSYDLLREGLVVLALIALLVLVMAIVFGSPDYPPVTGRQVATRQPVAFLKTAAGILAGQSEIQTYGPPYTGDRSNAQEFIGIAPANLTGRTIPLDPARDLVLDPLKRVAVLDTSVAVALRSYEAAPEARQDGWLKAYLAGLGQAHVVNGQVDVPVNGAGPVPVLMDGMLRLARAGLLEGALESGPGLPYTLNFTRPLLFFQGSVDHNVARSLDMTGEQWGISHETGPYPGAWWLWPYTFLYQIPPMSTSPNGDLQVVIIMTVLFVVLLFLPFVPVANGAPRWLGVHRIIWRDWYKRRG